jgi:glycosyltransferase involved in cell wall biosynthesis
MSGINVCGFFGSPKGLGQSARNCVTALEAAGVEHSLVNYPVAGVPEPQWQDRGTHYDYSVFHCNPDSANGFHRYLGAAFKQRKAVAYWFWELEDLPKSWLPWLDRYEEIWCPTRFVFDAVSKHTDRCRMLPMAIDVSGASADRQRFGIPEGKLAVLSMFDFMSTLDRKNPADAIEAFKRASVPNSVFVLKSHCIQRAARRLVTAMVRHCGSDCVWIDETLSRSDTLSLIASCDVLLSLHRSEGFGLPIAEAMAMGTIAIATGYGGCADFMTADNSCIVPYKPCKAHNHAYQGVWAQPNVDVAARYLDAIAHDKLYRRNLAQRACQDMIKHHSPKVVGGQWKEAIRGLYV